MTYSLSNTEHDTLYTMAEQPLLKVIMVQKKISSSNKYNIRACTHACTHARVHTRVSHTHIQRNWILKSFSKI
jgi:hypothetical protein